MAKDYVSLNVAIGGGYAPGGKDGAVRLNRDAGSDVIPASAVTHN
jgi:hypothetical protein